MISFLFQAVGEKQLRAISEAYFDLNQSIFTDSKEQHTSEAEAIIKGRRETWLADLKSLERQFFDSLPCLHGQAFRICRDLSISSADNGEEWSFFLSYSDLGHRLNCHPMEAQRILATFERIGLMSIFEKGTQHSPTERGKATKWLWNA